MMHSRSNEPISCQRGSSPQGSSTDAAASRLRLIGVLLLCAVVLGLASLAEMSERVHAAMEEPAAAPEAKPAATNETAPDFDKDIRPLLLSKCNDCHGAEKQESELRLDLRDAAFKGGFNGSVITPGKPDDSELLRRVTTTDRNERMPPKGEPLTASEIDTLRRWIQTGADWPADTTAVVRKNPAEHWGFQAPQLPTVPKVTRQDWANSPIDAFVLARLESSGLQPSPPTDRVTLCRRVHLDLTGLPPTPQQVDEFVKDTRPDAFARLVDSLLASPHYGERWARHWLDAARYADSDGYEKDKSREISFYRDYVINSLNNDLPYDQFLREQLAGDLMPNATQDQLVATGFLRNSMLNEEGGVDPEQFRMDAMFDRMDAIGKSVLGLTIQCAQCHNHKFDPLTQEEYYRLFAFLNNDNESQSTVYTVAEQAKIAELRAKMAAIDARILATVPDIQQQLAAWEDSVRNNQPEWVVLDVDNASDNSQRYFKQPDGSILAQGYAPTKFTTLMRGNTSLKNITAFRIEQLNDPNLPCNGPGRSTLGMAALTEFNVEVVDAADGNKKEWVKFVSVTADYSNTERELAANFDDKSGKRRVTGPVSYAIDGNDDTAWGIDAGPGRRNVPRVAVFVAEKPVGFETGSIVTFHLKQMHGGWNSDDNMNHNLGRFRLSATTAANPVADPIPPAVRAILAIPASSRTPEQSAAVFATFRSLQPAFASENAEIETLWQQWPGGSSSLVLTSREKPRSTMMLQRGDFLKPGKPVEPGVPSFLHPLANESAPRNRLTFAEWVTDRRSPTTARVAVNRIWQAYFGTGILSTPEDFGMQAAVPSHPELLDWLAVDFMDHGWSLKHLHRRIILSQTYQQSSRVTEELYAADQFNRLLARFPRLRVEGEIVRDIALAASGLLTDRLGGPSIFSPAPAFLFTPPASYGPFTWNEATGPDRYRRAIYTFRRRSTPYPMLQAFDAPNGDAACVRRVRTNTPLQALTALNETVFMECARGLAIKTLREHADDNDTQRITAAFRSCVARVPVEKEIATLLTLLNKQKQRFSSGELNPWELAANDPAVPVELPPGVTAADLAAWTAVSRVLLNLDETVTRE